MFLVGKKAPKSQGFKNQLFRVTRRPCNRQVVFWLCPLFISQTAFIFFMIIIFYLVLSLFSYFASKNKNVIVSGTVLSVTN